MSSNASTVGHPSGTVYSNRTEKGAAAFTDSACAGRNATHRVTLKRSPHHLFLRVIIIRYTEKLRKTEWNMRVRASATLLATLVLVMACSESSHGPDSSAGGLPSGGAGAAAGSGQAGAQLSAGTGGSTAGAAN